MDDSEKLFICLVESHMGTPEEFLSKLNEVLDQTPGRTEDKIDQLLEWVNILWKRSDFNLAYAVWDDAKKKSIENNYKGGEFHCYANLGLCYHRIGYFHKGIEFQNKALEIAKENYNKEAESHCYVNLGNAYHSSGDFHKGIEFQNKALEIAKQIDNKEVESKCYVSLGNAYHSSGDFHKGIEFQNKALEIAKQIDNKEVESECYVNLGTVSFRLGNYPKAIEFQNKALEIAKYIDYKEVESRCHANLGLCYHRIGYFHKGIEFQNKALEIAKEIGDTITESRCYGNIGLGYQSLEDHPKSIEFQNKALEIAKEIGDTITESRCHANLGNAYHSSGDFHKAIEFQNKALEIAKEIGDKITESRCYGNIGNAYRGLRNDIKAIEFYNKALVLGKENGDIFGEANSNLVLGSLYFYKQETEKAYDYLKRSIELNDVISEKLVEEEEKISLFGTQSDVYQIIVLTCLILKKNEEAFEYVERSKSRAFLDLISTGKVQPTVKDIHIDFKLLLDKEEIVLLKLRNIQTRHLRTIDNTQSTEPGFIEQLLQERKSIYEQMKKFDPEYVFLRSGDPLSVDKLQNILKQKSENAILVEYFLTQDKVFIFVVSQDSLVVEPWSLSSKEMSEFDEKFKNEVVQYADYRQYMGSHWKGIATNLIAPIKDCLEKAELIYFVPYGKLHHLPIHALELSGKPLIQSKRVAYLPSASLIQFFSGNDNGIINTCASFAVPGKDDSKEDKKTFYDEAKWVANRYNTKEKLDVTKDDVISTIQDKNYDLLHFSCHGIFDDKDPLSSGISLNDGILSAREIFEKEIRLDSKLVTLSACDTGISENKAGDELIGLTRALLYAGAQSIVVSLWKVDTSVTQKMMEKFYEYLKKGNVAYALKKAQDHIMNLDEEYSHPFYWAPFVVVGNSN